MPILQQTRLLHQDNNIMMTLHGHLRIHQISFARFEPKVTKKERPRILIDHWEEELSDRINGVIQLLDYYEMMVSGFLEQQQNLLSLVCHLNLTTSFRTNIEQAFNIEAVKQGQAVSRLNTLALIFLPLGFAAVGILARHLHLFRSIKSSFDF